MRHPRPKRPRTYNSRHVSLEVTRFAGSLSGILLMRVVGEQSSPLVYMFVPTLNAPHERLLVDDFFTVLVFI